MSVTGAGTSERGRRRVNAPPSRAGQAQSQGQSLGQSQSPGRGTRIRLAVDPGREPVIYVHDLAVPRAERDAQAAGASAARGAWTYAQRGHAPSGWAAGGLYRVSDFAIDLIRLLGQVGQPCLLAGAGAGGLVALLAAAAVPDRVTGLHLLPGGGEPGWGADPALMLTDGVVLNRGWLDAIRAPGPDQQCRQARQGATTADDPLLGHGPAEKLFRPGVRAAAAHLAVPWTVTGDHFLEPMLPAVRS